jgi:hypothetical protein
MPILMICLATAIALEDRSIDLLRGRRWTTGVTVVFVLAIGLTPMLDG